MSKVKVLVVAHIGKSDLPRIADVGAKIEVTDGFGLWVAPDLFISDRKEDSQNPEFSALLAKTKVMYGLRFSANLSARAPKLKWIQRMGTGVNSVLTDDIVNNPVIVTKFCHTKE